MSQPQDSSLLNVFAPVPDPRHARGKQVAWVVMLGVIASALLSQKRRAAAMAQWAQAHAGPLVAAFRPQRKRVPSEATMYRNGRHIDVRLLEARRARVRERPPGARAHAARPKRQGYAVAGNYVRGAGAPGRRPLRVRLGQHHDGRGIAQRAVAPPQPAGTASAPLLA